MFINAHASREHGYVTYPRERDDACDTLVLRDGGSCSLQYLVQYTMVVARERDGERVREPHPPGAPPNFVARTRTDGRKEGRKDGRGIKRLSNVSHITESRECHPE